MAEISNKPITIPGWFAWLLGIAAVPVALWMHGMYSASTEIAAAVRELRTEVRTTNQSTQQRLNRLEQWRDANRK